MRETIEEREAQSLSRPAVGNAKNRRERAETEVTNISKLFAEGKDLQARQYLDELINRQTADPRSLSYAVMSLCNIANRCSTAGRRDVGFACLTRAVELPNGLDAILYLQIGNEFRSIREFDKAIDCYEKAKAIDDGSKAESIRDEIIRVSVAKGEYDRALEQYLTIDEIGFLPSTHTSLGAAICTD